MVTERELHVSPLRSLAADAQFVLRPSHSRSSVVLPIPLRARVRDGVVELALTFHGNMDPQSNVRVLVDGKRRAMIRRADADSGGHAHVTLPLAESDFHGVAPVLGLESALLALGKQCDDERYIDRTVEVDSASRYIVHVDTLSPRIGSGWVGLTDSATFVMPARPLRAGELDTILAASSRLSRRGGYVRIAPAASTTRTTNVILPSELLRSDPIVIVPEDLNPSFTELHAQSAPKEFLRTVEWSIPLDVRLLPAGQVPERLILKMVAAPNEARDNLLFHVVMNGELLRNADVRSDGSRRTIRVNLPDRLERIYNEVRFIGERISDTLGTCVDPRVTRPAQIQDDSYLGLGRAPPKPQTIAGLVGLLGSRFELFVPRESLVDAAAIVPLLVTASQTLWGPLRGPRVVPYEATPEPGNAAVVIARPAGTRTVLRLARMNGSTVLVVTPAVRNARISALPEAYAERDSVAFGEVDDPVRPLPPLRLNTSQFDAVAFAADRAKWVVLLAFALLTGAAFTREIMQRGKDRK